MQEFGTSAKIEQETIRAVVLAYAEGKIELIKPKAGKGSGKGLRYAPSFLVAKEDFKGLKIFPYNAESIARFLGWMSGNQVSPRVRNALEALEAYQDQELARLFAECGWTQERIGQKMGKSQNWVSYRLRFGGFLRSITSCDKNESLPANLTEGRFRTSWERTKGTEEERFEITRHHHMVSEGLTGV